MKVRSQRDLVLPFISVLCVLFLFEYGSPAVAGLLSIQTRTEVTVTGNLLQVIVNVTNKGNVPAYDVQALLLLLGDTISTSPAPILEVNESIPFRFKKKLKGIKKGRYPVIVQVNFHDANQYPFSSLSGSTFCYKEDTSPDLICQTKDITIRKEGELALSVKNPGYESRAVRVRIVLPREFSSPKPEINIKLGARREERIVFPISNFSALPGATYPVFFSLEYDLHDSHYSLLTRAVVKTWIKENWFSRTQWLWIGIGVLAGLILVFYQFRRSR